MNIIEAIRSGRPLRRKSLSDHCGSNGEGYVCPDLLLHSRLWPSALTVADILADNWEIQEKKVEVTRKQVSDAIIDFNSAADMTTFIRKVCRRLGLD